MKTCLIAGLTSLVCIAGAHPFMNGSFETGPNAGSFVTLAAGSTALDGWTVGGNSIDYIGSYWGASDGSHSIDLGGNDNGSLFQTIDTIVGQSYTLTFDLSGNPDRRPSNGDYIVTVLAKDQSNVTDLNSAFTYHNLLQTKGNMMWQSYSITFVATGTSTTLSFVDTAPPGAYGPALDHVNFAETTPEPVSMSLIGASALAAFGKIRRRKRAA